MLIEVQTFMHGINSGLRTEASIVPKIRYMPNCSLSLPNWSVIVLYFRHWASMLNQLLNRFKPSNFASPRETLNVLDNDRDFIEGHSMCIYLSLRRIQPGSSAESALLFTHQSLVGHKLWTQNLYSMIIYRYNSQDLSLQTIYQSLSFDMVLWL